MPLSRRALLATTLLISLPVAGCGATTDDPSAGAAQALSGNPDDIDIGFNGAAGGFGVDQFQYFPLFFDASPIHPGPRLCHTYVEWNVADQPPAMGDASSPAGDRAAFEYWLSHAQKDGHCEEVLVSFQAHSVDGNGKAVAGERCANGSNPPCAAPDEQQVRDAFQKFVETDWAQSTGFTGSFAFTAWNEPNNQYGAGNGLGTVIAPEAAARFYMTLASLCLQHGCKVAAGDFASNGSWPRDFEWNCANDNVGDLTTTDKNGKRWCETPSSENPGNQLEASYLDLYKNTIARESASYGLPARPKYFAYHGWHDANDYVNSGEKCLDYGDCVTRRLLASLGGSWGGVDIWDTEVGSSQGQPIDDATEACGAAFLLSISSISPRITRLYYTRLHGGAGELVSGNDPKTAKRKPALEVLAQRKTHEAGCR
jgi:hypothetical protein